MQWRADCWKVCREMTGMTFVLAEDITAHWPIAWSMLAHRLRRWINIEPAMGESIVFAGQLVLSPEGIISQTLDPEGIASRNRDHVMSGTTDQCQMYTLVHNYGTTDNTVPRYTLLVIMIEQLKPLIQWSPSHRVYTIQKRFFFLFSCRLFLSFLTI